MWTLWILGCACNDPPQTDDDPRPTGVVDDTGDTMASVPTGSTADTAPIEDTAPPLGIVDCATIPAVPIGASVLAPTFEASDGLAFDDLGGLYAASSTILRRYESSGLSTVLPVTLSGHRRVAVGPGGEVYSTVMGGILEVLPNGTQTLIGTTIGSQSLYDLKVGPDARVYAANGSAVWRMDRVTGAEEQYFLDGSSVLAQVIDWSPDGSTMYIGGRGNGVHSLALDANSDPLGGPVLLSTSDVGLDHEAMTVDVCGNVYVSDFDTQALYRIDLTGTVSVLLSTPLSGPYGSEGPYARGMAFGSGIGGWLAESLYLAQPYNGDAISEVDVGVPHRTWQGTVLNGP